MQLQRKCDQQQRTGGQRMCGRPTLPEQPRPRVSRSPAQSFFSSAQFPLFFPVPPSCGHVHVFVSLSQVSSCNVSPVTPSSGSGSLASPLGSGGRPKFVPNSSLCLESGTSLSSRCPKAPGFEREDQVRGAAHARHVTGALLIFLPFSFLIVFNSVFLISSAGRYSLRRAGRSCDSQRVTVSRIA